MMSAMDSANPSTSPTARALAPSVVTMNIGRRAWIISEEISMSMLTKPNTQMPAGKCFSVWPFSNAMHVRYPVRAIPS